MAPLWALGATKERAIRPAQLLSRQSLKLDFSHLRMGRVVASAPVRSMGTSSSQLSPAPIFPGKLAPSWEIGRSPVLLARFSW
jgi:hypothetical protein